MLCMHLILLLIVNFGFLKKTKSNNHCFQLFQRLKEPWEFMNNKKNHIFVGNHFIIFYFIDNENYK
jgi:hypothetical protein